VFVCKESDVLAHTIEAINVFLISFASAKDVKDTSEPWL
jgi:hypothetical protein